MSGAQLYRINWVGVMTSNELPDEADRFAREYLDLHNDIYTAFDFQEVLASELPTIYHVEDSLENYRIIEAVITERYEEWKRHGKIKQKDV